MGDLEAVNRLMRERAPMMDNLCLGIIDPPMQERLRDDLLPDYGASVEGSDGRHHNSRWLPKMEPWRVSKEVGIKLDNATHVVRANYFNANPSMLPDSLYHYHISIFRFDHEGNLLMDDLAKTNERNVNSAILKDILHRKDLPFNQSAVRGKKVGFAYDGKSSMYCTAPMEMIESRDLQCDVTWPPNTQTTYHVVMSLVATIPVPKNHSKNLLLLLSILVDNHIYIFS
jgi:hypothetical protein